MTLCDVCIYQFTLKCDSEFERPSTSLLMAGEKVIGCNKGIRDRTHAPRGDIIDRIEHLS